MICDISKESGYFGKKLLLRLFFKRYIMEMIEDEGFFLTVSRDEDLEDFKGTEPKLDLEKGP